MVVAHTTVDIPALKARHPLGDTVEASGVQSARSWQGPPGRLPLPRRGGGELHGVRRLGAVLLLRLRRRGRRAGLHPACREPEPAGGHRATGRQPWACAQGRQPSSRNAASQVRRAGSKGPRLANGGGAVLRRTAAPSFGGAGVPGLAGRRPVRRSPPGPRLCAGQRAARVP